MLDNAKYHARTNKIRTSGNGQCEVLGRNKQRSTEVLKGTECTKTYVKYFHSVLLETLLEVGIGGKGRED